MGEPILTHEHLFTVVKQLPADYTPWGTYDRNATDDAWCGDCSSGCKFYAILDGHLGADWGVCTNPASHRAGLLTFEHQGCCQFTQDDEPDA
jgi:hypothetical protein